MRPLTALAVAVAAFAWSGSALAGPPASGFLVFKESRAGAVTELRADGSGRLLAREAAHAKAKGGKKHQAEDCRDASNAPFGATWPTMRPRYLVNSASTPAGLDRQKTLEQIRRSHDAWRFPFVTDCKRPKPSTPQKSYRPVYGGETTRLASLVAWLERDGVNTVAFQSLEGTVCDGASACVIVWFDGGDILEADLAFEPDLTRYGLADFWTNDERTWWDDLGGEWAIMDVATHEFGHFAGLDHVWESPALTMFPFVHDGAQTLGLGDMLGMHAMY